MLFIDNQGITNPKINLAIEEFVLRHLDVEKNDYLLFYINEPSIIIGKNQNTIEEINQEYVKDNNIHVVRRLSGGGAVYHDFGNLNFSFITKDDGNSFHNFKKFTDPVVQALREMGVEAQLSGRNDIQVGERKISGNAQFATKGRMFSHGTLLFDSEMEHVVSALKVNEDKIKSKSIKSIRSRVANISEFLPEKIRMEEFQQRILNSIFYGQEISQYHLTEADWSKIHKLSEERYQNWDWNYGKSPKFNLKQSKRFPIGSIDVRLNVEKGIITDTKIYGDFFGVGEVADVERVLTNIRHDETSVRDALEGMDLKHYFGNLEKEEFIGLLF